jgi:hypothetical protein
MTEDEMIQAIEDARAEAKRQAAEDIALDLADFLKSVDKSERAGIKAAIEIIKENY